MTKLTVINGSMRVVGYTQKVLMKEKEMLQKRYDILERDTEYFWLDNNIRACNACDKCIEGCQYSDQFTKILNSIALSEIVLFGSPVYLDLPSAKMVAFLTRLNCMAENTKREFFKGKKAYFVSVGYCSGTKCVIIAMQGACEMLGFDIPGRSSKEYIILWKDKKVRGGFDDSFNLE
jgi:multimeric flavodoxin WrbA